MPAQMHNQYSGDALMTISIITRDCYDGRVHVVTNGAEMLWAFRQLRNAKRFAKQLTKTIK